MDPHEAKPQEPQDPRTLHIPQRQFVSEQQQAAAHIVRQQIDRLYDTAPPNQPATPQPEPAQEVPEAYARTHQENFDWRQYHSAWQQYYQQYYQRYYWQHLHSERQKLAATAADQAVANAEGVTVGVDPNAPKSTQKTVASLRSDITAKVKERAQKVRKSHHFVPLLSALAVGLIFVFLQFNSVVFAQIQSYISPGAISNDSITINPSVAVNVGPEPKLIIPKINVEVPVDYNITTVNEQDIQNSLRDGATHYKLPGASATPGQNGNTVILGHSSNDIFNQGAYKFVFVLLDRLQPGDVFYLHYNGTRYIYRVTETRVIDPTDIKALQVGTDKPMATLITCTPPGTALKRLIIFGEQISPDPGGATSAASTEPTQNATIPGNGPTLLDQIWQFFF
ncbi:MAG TPA: sortase [Magnetospirillaceae bacterium]|nr:sortase [Magnetospirillaceae bacterium]